MVFREQDSDQIIGGVCAKHFATHELDHRKKPLIVADTEGPLHLQLRCCPKCGSQVKVECGCENKVNERIEWGANSLHPMVNAALEEP